MLIEAGCSTSRRAERTLRSEPLIAALTPRASHAVGAGRELLETRARGGAVNINGIWQDKYRAGRAACVRHERCWLIRDATMWARGVMVGGGRWEWGVDDGRHPLNAHLALRTPAPRIITSTYRSSQRGFTLHARARRSVPHALGVARTLPVLAARAGSTKVRRGDRRRGSELGWRRAFVRAGGRRRITLHGARVEIVPNNMRTARTTRTGRPSRAGRRRATRVVRSAWRPRRGARKQGHLRGWATRSRRSRAASGVEGQGRRTECATRHHFPIDGDAAARDGLAQRDQSELPTVAEWSAGEEEARAPAALLGASLRAHSGPASSE